MITSLPVFLTAAVALHVLCRSFCLLSRFKIIIKRLFFKVTEPISHLTRVEGNSLRTRLRIGLQHNLPPPCRSHVSNCCVVRQKLNLCCKSALFCCFCFLVGVGEGLRKRTNIAVIMGWDHWNQTNC